MEQVVERQMEDEARSYEPGGPDAPASVPPPPGAQYAPVGGSVATATPADGSTSRPRRRWPWILVVVLLLASLGLAVAVALDQRDVAASWQQRAVVLEGQRDDAIARGTALQQQLDEVVALVAASESDVAELEARVRELADEKAQAEDTATTVQVERDVVLDVSQRIADATEALDACITRLFDLQGSSVEAFNRSAAGESVDVEPLNAQARDVTSFCNDARSAAAAASTAADRLTSP